MHSVAPLPESQQLPQLLGSWLQKHANLSAGECQHILNLWQEQQHETRLPQLLLKLGAVSPSALSVGLSELLNLPRLTSQDHPDRPICNDVLSIGFLKRHRILPIAADDNNITLAMTDPSDELAVQSVSLACQKNVQRVVIDDSELQELFDCLYGESDSALNQLLDGMDQGEASNEVDINQLRDMASEAPVIRLVNLLIQTACERNASDIHIEPFEKSVKVRLRCDGSLTEIEAPPPQMAAAVISRIKIMASLDIAERRLPQDGRINMKVQGSSVDIRVSTVPCIHGESVVMRLLRRDQLVLDFAHLGLTRDALHQLKQLLAHPHGLLVVSGPTGSGKTTTLYTALSQLNRPERKIITVEDPVEYKLNGINQIQVNAGIGLSFASALRTIVRQDPDVIMVGEMRDLEAARICVQSALTGHLVLSTLHTNEAAGCITRLLEMGVEDYLLSSTLTAAIGQRLVKRLCRHCAESYQPVPELLHAICRHTSQKPDPDMRLYHPKGCDKCGQSGFSGRIAIVEILEMSEAIRQQILQHADARQLQKTAIKEGMRTLYVDGCLKALAGETTFEEVLRVTQEQ